ncbi:uncharacterized protein CTHT_0070440 [Thermochaetoides thermophila DSM 1495]|uniref:Uncharacterized protein n=1 Tax=Chaetomium thermophilum (strain DSM 1495 / CBS 144.50 / IMI 039719) TaxID=759272 RepID=G0SHL3_CHATD|nr:hypothetical protein CTHT_0070440 [Thermochaetoides thermophila DSM 1495]EGS17702.1 hypothetical protein CTHT_0070440 [Thermochaetoides thermophila DSM 1495]
MGSSSDDNNPPINPFIRFAQHVNQNIQAGLNTINPFASSSSNPSPPQSLPASSDTQTPSDAIVPSTDNLPSAPLDPATAHFETRLSLLRGGTRPEADLAWRLFLRHSTYSPLRLDRELGWRPRPYCPDDPGLDTSQFGWADAFEDLMLAQSGVERMSDLREKSELFEGWAFGSRGLPWDEGEKDVTAVWRPFHFTFPFGMGFGFGGVYGPVTFGAAGSREWREMAWLRRMHERRLNEVYFPVQELGKGGYRSPETMEEWVEFRRREAERRKAMQDAWGRRLDNKPYESFGEEWERMLESFGLSDRSTENKDGKKDGHSVIDEIKSVFKAFDDLFPRHGHNKKDENHNPDTDLDLFESARSAFEDTHRSLSTFFKTFSNAWKDATNAAAFPPIPRSSSNNPAGSNPTKVETTESMEDGLMKRVTKKEYDDGKGTTHVVHETTWTDEEGRVVRSQRSETYRQQSSWVRKGGEEENKEKKEGEGEGEGNKKDGNGGWFWN